MAEEPALLSGGDYDAILVVSFGGPEGPDDVMPFLENVLRGKNVPHERMLEVRDHYLHFGGVSPINQQCRELLEALREELSRNGIDLPVYWGNRNWQPMLADTMAQMKADGVKKALGYFTAAYSSYSSCRQYRENILDAQEVAGDDAPQIDKIRAFYNHPDFVAVNAENVAKAISQFTDAEQSGLQIAFTAHSIPMSMARTSDYVQQLSETSRLVAEAVGLRSDRWQLVYQSRSGPPQVPWLEPDILDHLQALHESGVRDVIVMPIGFLSDHIEVLFDLDEQAAETATRLGIKMVRATTVGNHPEFLTMLRKLIEERLSGGNREAIGKFGPNHDVCPLDCCPRPQRPS